MKRHTKRVVGCLAAAIAAISGIAYAATAHNVAQKDKAFSQGELTAKVGDSITFKNEDTVVHNVYSKSAGNEFNTKSQPPGSTNSVPLVAEGDVEVRCAIHLDMKLIVHVKK